MGYHFLQDGSGGIELYTRVLGLRTHRRLYLAAERIAMDNS